MTTTETERLLSVLDAQDVRALRHADTIVFRHYQGQGAIRVIRDGRNTPTGFDAEHYIWTDAGITDYGQEAYEGHVRLTPDTMTCYHSEQSPSYDPAIHTLVRRLSVGDTIRLVWIRDNNTETIRTAGLHIDSLKLEVSKKGDPKRRETYDVGFAVTPDNSARMIRRAY